MFLVIGHATLPEDLDSKSLSGQRQKQTHLERDIIAKHFI